MLVKIFERSLVIRLFGLALIIAPFVNIMSSVSELPDIQSKFYVYYCWQFLRSAPLTQQILQIASFGIGALMLRGSVAAWKYTLALLGGYIILQFMQLNSGARDNMTWIFLGLNVVLFFFIADQIVLKPRPKGNATATNIVAPNATPLSKASPLKVVSNTFGPKQKSPKPLPSTEISSPAQSVAPVARNAQNNIAPLAALPKTSVKTISVNFEGFGNWAAVTDISEAGITLSAHQQPPLGLSEREVEVCFSPQLVLRLKLASQENNLFKFSFVNLESASRLELNRWLTQLSAS